METREINKYNLIYIYILIRIFEENSPIELSNTSLRIVKTPSRFFAQDFQHNIYFTCATVQHSSFCYSTLTLRVYTKRRQISIVDVGEKFGGNVVKMWENVRYGTMSPQCASFFVLLLYLLSKVVHLHKFSLRGSWIHGRLADAGVVIANPIPLQ